MTKSKYFPKISVYVTKDEMTKWGKIAKKHGMPLSSWIKTIVLDYIVIDSKEKPTVDAPEIIELLQEIKQLKEENAQLKSKLREQEYIDQSKILANVTNEWKSTSQIAIESGVYNRDLLMQFELAKKTHNQNQQQEIHEILMKGDFEVQDTLLDYAENDLIQMRKNREGVMLWKRK